MWCIKFFRIFALMGMVFHLHAQNPTPRFLESQFMISNKFSNVYTANLGLSSRMVFNEVENSLPIIFVNLSHFSSFRIANNSHLGLGVMYRFADAFEDQSFNEFRLTQQFYTIFKPSVIRYAHRFRMEERFIGSDTFMRLRYRMGIDFPLNGQALDLKEAYALFNVESLLQLNRNQSPRVDFRISGGVGVLITPKLKLQGILQHRFEHLTQIQEGRWFGFLGGYIKI